MTFFLLFLALSLPAQAATSPVSVTVIRNGRDSNGASARERLEITYDGLARWETTSFGLGGVAGCGNEGGSFEGRVSKTLALELAHAVKAALDSQHPPKAEALPAPRSVSTTLWLDLDGKASSASVRKWTPQYDALMKMVSQIKTSLRPKSLVTMRAKRDGALLRVLFDYAGDRPVKILIPDNPMEAFRAGDERFKYTIAVSDDYELELDASHRHSELDLRTEGRDAKLSPALVYTNETGLHHQKGDALDGDRMPPQLWLCARIDAKH